LKGSKTFGESKSLKKLILETITPGFFEKMKNQHVDVVITVSNISLGKVEYKSIKDFNREEFCDWIWASANLVPFMSLVKKDGYEYGDGGLGTLFQSQKQLTEALEK